MRYGRSSTVIEDGRPYQIPGYCPHHARVMYDMIQSAWAERQAEEVRAFYSYAAHVYEQMEGRKP